MEVPKQDRYLKSNTVLKMAVGHHPTWLQAACEKSQGLKIRSKYVLKAVKRKYPLCRQVIFENVFSFI